LGGEYTVFGGEYTVFNEGNPLIKAKPENTQFLGGEYTS
jgi:hypothetical protein